MTPRKVIFLGPAYPYRGGIATFNQQLALCFQENDWIVEMETYSYQYPSILFPGKNQLTKDPKPENLTIRRSLHSLSPLNWKKLAKNISKRKPDLIIGQYWMPFISLGLGSTFRALKKRYPYCKTATIVHNLIPHESKPGDGPLTQFMLNSSDYFISLSKKVSEDIKMKKADAKIIPLFHPIYNNYGSLIDKHKAKEYLSLNPKSNYVLFFGLVRAYKGLDLLIEAMADPTLKDKELLVIGEFYEDIKKYKQVIDNLNLTDRIHIRNEFIPDELVKYYFSASDLVVLPYKTATQSGITQIALHFQKPIVATNVGGLDEVVKHGENGFLVNPNANELTDAISKFYSEDLEDKFSKASLKLKTELSWQEFYNKLLDSIDGE